MGSPERPVVPDPRFAIVGYAARFPGAPDADGFWDVLREGRDAVSDVPGDRWDVDEFFDPDPGAPGKVVTRRAGFVEDVAGFDAPFFGLSTREVRLMDPHVNATAVFDYPTIGGLAEYLVGQLPDAASPPGEARPGSDGLQPDQSRAEQDAPDHGQQDGDRAAAPGP
jgi:Beta-ketoacyl synthase, N-terminal domain